MWSAQGQKPESGQPCQKSNYTFVPFVSTYQRTECPIVLFSSQCQDLQMQKVRCCIQNKQSTVSLSKSVIFQDSRDASTWIWDVFENSFRGSDKPSKMLPALKLILRCRERKAEGMQPVIAQIQTAQLQPWRYMPRVKYNNLHGCACWY